MEYQIRLRKTDGKKIYVDPQEEEGFYLYPTEVKKSALEDEMLISEEMFCQIRELFAVPRAKKRALGLLIKKDLTEKELVEKLEKSYHDSYSIAVAMAFVTQHGYVDDERYAQEYFYYRKGRKSFRRIQEELTRKGIPYDILRRVMEEEGEQSEEDVRPLVEKYARKFQELDYQARQKICMHFGRKGYSIELIRRIIDELEEKE